MKSNLVTRWCLASLCLVFSGSALAVNLDQFDRFDDSTEGWTVGGFGNQPLTLAQSLLVISGGGTAPNGRLVVFNKSQWAGNYNALGSDLVLQMDLDPGSDPLIMRIAVGNLDGSWFVTNNAAAISLEANSGVSTATFTLNTTDMVSVDGSDSLQTILDNVSELRILHRTSQSDFRGDEMSAFLKVDNIGFLTDGVEAEEFEINQGIAGAWFNPETSGQGFLIDIEPASQFMFVAWFTYSSDSTKVGAVEHRWLTAAGNYSNGTAQIPIFATTMGRFDNPQPVTDEQVGTLTVTFSDCETGTIEYDLPDDGLQGEIPVIRAVPAGKALCLMLAEPATN